MTFRTISILGGLAMVLAGCSSSSDDGAAGGSGGGGGAATCPKKYGTVVIVGDSISDEGSGSELDKQQPFWREILVKNDDTRYPAWAGKDLTTCWAETVNVVKVSKGGAIATEVKSGQSSVLLDQVKAIPATLPGPVLVLGTIGGNDVQAALPLVVFGSDVTVQLNAFQKGLDDAFTELTKAGRFGAGVDVDVYITNTYDPSGGTSVFAFADGTSCAGLLGSFPKNKPTDPLLKPWNDVYLAEQAKFSNVHIIDLHEDFRAHGAPATDTWFYSDCIHPNTAGHQALRELFWNTLVAAAN